MNTKEALAALEAAGTAQNRKVYARHGVNGACYGVSYANQGKLRKRIGTDHDLAAGLWASGNHDARVLATMVADPARMDARTLDAWAKALDSYVITDAFSQLAAKSPAGPARARKWVRSRAEWVAAAGWNVVTILAQGASEAFGDDELEGLLETIEAGVQRAANRVRYAMNGALIAIGARSAAFAKLATAAAKRIGPIEVDHGETGCKTPDAASYIRKMRERRGGRAAAKK